MPTYQQGMTYQHEGGAIIPIVSQADLDNLASVGINPINPATSTSSGGYQDSEGIWRYGTLPGQAPAPNSPTPTSPTNTPINTPTTPTTPGVTNDTSDIRSSLESDLKTYLDEIEKYRASQKTALDNQISGIESQFAGIKSSTQQRQRGETGQRTMMLAGTGALGRTVSGQENLIALGRAQDAEIAELESKKQSLINQARDAYNTNDFKLMSKKLDLVRQTRLDIEDAENKRESMRIQKAQEERAVQEFKYQLEDLKRKDQSAKADLLVPGIVSKDADGNYQVPTEEEIMKIASENGIDYNVIAQTINKQLDALRKLDNESFKDYFNIAKQLEEGQSLEAPDGTIITGLKKGELITYEANIGGVKYKVAVDKNTGEEKWRKSIGAASGSGGGAGKTISWDRAKQLGRMDLYGKPESELYVKPESETYEQWISRMNLEDPQNYPLTSSNELQAEYEASRSNGLSPMEEYQNNLDNNGDDQGDSESTAIDIVNANIGQLGDSPTEEDITALINFILQNTDLTYAQAKKIVEDNL